MSPSGVWAKTTRYHSLKAGLTYRLAPVEIPWAVLRPEIQWVAYDNGDEEGGAGWNGHSQEPMYNTQGHWYSFQNWWNLDALGLPPAEGGSAKSLTARPDEA